MKLKAKSVSEDRLTAGNYVAICNAVIDLGMQPGRGRYPAPKQEVLLNFELPTETYEYEGKTIVRNIHRRFTASMSTKANLRKFIAAWFGKPFDNDAAAEDFDLQKLLGRRCLLNVTTREASGKTYTNIESATPVPKGMDSKQPQTYASWYYNLEAPDHATYGKFPEWLQKVISGRVQTGAVQGPATSKDLVDDMPADDDIPF